jgi:beta-1,4-mannosyl-glycoprotein beta-1,4-N-acetylglucosaminyltransferase
MLYEFFYLHDEVEWLMVKLHEAGDEVDKFVVSECRFDCLHKPKPLYYGDNKSKFAEFNHKIIHVITDDLIKIGVNMHRTRLASCAQGFKDCQPDDILIVADPDVVLKRDTYRVVKQLNLQNNEIGISCDWYMYYMDYLFTKEKFINSTAFLYKNTVDSEWDTVNRFRPVSTWVQDAGWHFSKMGGAVELAKHIESYPHGHCDYPNLLGMEGAVKLMQERIDGGLCWEGGYPGEVVVKQVPYIPGKYPIYVQQHPEIFSKYFKGGMNAQ